MTESMNEFIKYKCVYGTALATHLLKTCRVKGPVSLGSVAFLSNGEGV